MKYDVRERMMKQDAALLSDDELIMVILSSGSKTASIDVISQELLRKFPKLSGLNEATVSELTEVEGIGQVKAIQIKAIVELGSRILNRQECRGEQIVSSQQIGNFMSQKMSHLRQEHFVALYLDTKNQIITEQTISIGTLNTSIAHPRDVFHYALKYQAARLIVVHNHPSGQLSPSQNDIELSKRLLECGDVMGICCLDHLIVGGGRYISLKEENLI